MPARRPRPLPERLRDAVARAQDVDALARTVFATVAADIPFAFACVATTDPASELITGAIKSAPLPMGDEEFSAAEYGVADINQFAEISRRPVPVGVLSIDTDGHVERCRRFRDYMVPQFGFTDELRLACRAQGTTWALLALYRGPGDPPFTAADARLAASVHEVVADGMRRVLFSKAPSPATTRRVPVVLIVDAADRVTDMTAATHEVVEELGGWFAGSLPSNLLAVAAAARGSGHPAQARARGRSGGWLTIRAMTLEGSGSSNRSVVLTVDSADQASVGEMSIAAKGLTAREQDVVALVLQGASTKVIATSLHLSPHTVQDHLKAVFEKLGVSSRREMVARFVLP